MKIIFLDIDGVLNNQMMYEYYKDDIIKTSLKSEHLSGDLDPRCIELFNSLIEDTDAKVVLSSTWRFSGEKVMQGLNDIGLKCEFIGMTPRSNHAVRGVEIQDWIRSNELFLGENFWNFRDYVIIDDDSDMLLNQTANYFRSDGYSGLTPNLIYRIKNYLNRGE